MSPLTTNPKGHCTLLHFFFDHYYKFPFITGIHRAGGGKKIIPVLGMPQSWIFVINYYRYNLLS